MPNVRCLDTAPIHNVKTENLFAHQAYAAQSTRASHNRLRGLGLCKASGTFTLETKLRSNRRKRFLHDVKRSKAAMVDWVEHHKDDKGFLNLFNTKYVSEKRRTELIRSAMSGRRDNKKKGILGKRTLNRMELELQDKNGFKRKEVNNEALIKTHRNKVVEHLKLRKRRRFRTVKELEDFIALKDTVAGLEYSHAEKCTILRDQVQLRKKLDGISRIGETNLHNFAGLKKYPNPLDGLWGLMKLMCAREAAHGIPPTVKPELLTRRSTKAADDELNTELLKRQHKTAEALTNAFYLNHAVEEAGEFTAYKMCRTLVESPFSYVDLAVQRKFNDGVVYDGVIAEYVDSKQWWRVKYPDGQEEDWSVPDMKRYVPSFKCGPVVDGVTEHTAEAQRERSRARRRNAVGGVERPVNIAIAVAAQIVPIIAAVMSGDEFELPDHHEDSVGTVFKLIKVSVDDGDERWGVVMPADEVGSVDEDDVKHLTPNELEDSYNCWTAPLKDIEDWIATTARLKAALAANPNIRTSSRVRRPPTG